MEAGQVLHVISTDPGAVMDFESFASQTGNELLSSESKDNKFYFLIKKN
jgi:tRNA 2-thiouridine synthesizing protein A